MTSNDNIGLCEHCVSGSLLPGEPKGSMEKIGPFDSYVAKPSTGKANSDTVLVFLYDAFGLNLKNNKLLPDQFADKLGLTVVVPDFFRGGGISEAVASSMPTSAAEGRAQSFLAKAKSAATMATIAPWFVRNRPTTKFKDFEKYLEVLKAEKGYTKFFTVSYCYGGAIASEFAARGSLDANYLCHPSLYEVEQISKNTKPIAFAMCELDNMTPPEKLEKLRALQAERKDKFQFEITVWPNTIHGNFARPNLAIPEVKAGFEGAFAGAVTFFKTQLGAGQTVAPATTEAVAAAA